MTAAMTERPAAPSGGWCTGVVREVRHPTPARPCCCGSRCRAHRPPARPALRVPAARRGRLHRVAVLLGRLLPRRPAARVLGRAARRRGGLDAPRRRRRGRRRARAARPDRRLVRLGPVRRPRSAWPAAPASCPWSRCCGTPATWAARTWCDLLVSARTPDGVPYREELAGQRLVLTRRTSTAAPAGRVDADDLRAAAARGPPRRRTCAAPRGSPRPPAGCWWTSACRRPPYASSGSGRPADGRPRTDSVSLNVFDGRITAAACRRRGGSSRRCRPGEPCTASSSSVIASSLLAQRLRQLAERRRELRVVGLAAPAPRPSTARGRSGCRGCRSRRRLRLGDLFSSRNVPVARSSVVGQDLGPRVAGGLGEVLEARRQREELAQAVPAQVVLLDELLHVLRRRPAGAGLEQAAAVDQRDDREHLGAGAELEDREQVGEVVAQHVAGHRDGVLALADPLERERDRVDRRHDLDVAGRSVSWSAR